MLKTRDLRGRFPESSTTYIVRCLFHMPGLHDNDAYSYCGYTVLMINNVISRPLEIYFLTIVCSCAYIGSERRAII